MNKEILIKYLNDNCSEEEFEKFVFWLKKEKESGERKSWILDDWRSFEPELGNVDRGKYRALLDKIHHEINLNQQKKEMTLTSGTVITWLSRAAAILFIPLFTTLVYVSTNNNVQLNQYAEMAIDSLEVIAPVGSRTVVQLTDGTEVSLNYGSRIKYPRVFMGDKREVELEGEGYFDVAHNPDKPFVVKTDKINVTALGTEFNVLAYKGEDVVATTLVNGKVVVDRLLPGKEIKTLGAMIPGQYVEYNIKTEEVFSSQGKIEKFIAWKDGKLVFDNEPISNVAQKLSRMFNVDIEIVENVKDLTYTVTFEDDPLFLILDLMTEVTAIKYKVFPRRKLSDGSYSKQKIRIEKR